LSQAVSIFRRAGSGVRITSRLSDRMRGEWPGTELGDVEVNRSGVVMSALVVVDVDATACEDERHLSGKEKKIANGEGF